MDLGGHDHISRVCHLKNGLTGSIYTQSKINLFKTEKNALSMMRKISNILKMEMATQSLPSSSKKQPRAGMSQIGSDCGNCSSLFE
jgi:hypothetical protein